MSKPAKRVPKKSGGLESVADQIALKYGNIGKVVQVAMQSIAALKRDIGEAIIKHYSPKAAAEKREFEQLTAEERQEYREDAEGISRDDLAELARLLQEKGIAEKVCSVTGMYESMRLAVAYRPSEIVKLVGKNLTLEHLLTLTRLADSTDRKKAVEQAVEQDAYKQEEFAGIVDKVAEESPHGFTASAKKAKKAAETRRGGGGRKKDNSGIPPAEDSLIKATSKMFSHLEDRLLTQLSNLAVKFKEEYPELSASDQDDALKEIEKLMPHLDTLDSSTKWIREIYAGIIKERDKVNKTKIL